MGWLSGSLVKNLVLVGIVLGVSATIYSMYRSVVNLEIKNDRLAAEVQRTTDEIQAVELQATMQAHRVIALNGKLKLVKQTLAISEARILDRNIEKQVKDDPEAAARALQEELNELFTEIEALVNTTY